MTTGPCGYEADGTPRVNEENGTKNSRQRKCASDDGLDINNGKAVSGRVAFSPMLGVEVAGSSYYGNAAPNGSSNPLSITAIDWTFQRGPFELIGELPGPMRKETRAPFKETRGICSRIFTDRNRGNSGRVSRRTHEWLLTQGNYHFMPAFLTKFSPRRFGEDHVKAVIRYDRVNTTWMTAMGQAAGAIWTDFIRPKLSPIGILSSKSAISTCRSVNPNNGERIHDSALVI